MFGNQCFIGSAYIFSCQKCFLYECKSRFHTAHYFHYDIDFRVIYDLLIIMNQNFLYRLSRKLTKVQNIFYIEFLSGTSCNAFFICV